LAPKICRCDTSWLHVLSYSCCLKLKGRVEQVVRVYTTSAVY
jgi:hypothetical protein